MGERSWTSLSERGHVQVWGERSHGQVWGERSWTGVG